MTHTTALLRPQRGACTASSGCSPPNEQNLLPTRHPSAVRATEVQEHAPRSWRSPTRTVRLAVPNGIALCASQPGGCFSLATRRLKMIAANPSPRPGGLQTSPECSASLGALQRNGVHGASRVRCVLGEQSPAGPEG